MLFRSYFLVAALTSLFAFGCDDEPKTSSMDGGDDGSFDGSGDGSFDAGDAGPALEDATLYFRGYALAVEDGVTAECLLEFVISDIQAREDGWVGTVSGEVTRAFLKDDEEMDGGSGGEFHADTGGLGYASFKTNGDLELALVGDQPNDAIPFWKAIETITGEPTVRNGAKGDWSCAPTNIDYGDATDDAVTADGTWTLKVRY